MSVTDYFDFYITDGRFIVDYFTRAAIIAIERRKALLNSQLQNCAMLAGVGLGVALIIWVFPTFFKYPYFGWGGLESIARFWPLMTWCVFLSTICAYSLTGMRTSEKKEVLGYGLLTSILAGIWEEIGYRFVFICYAMISIIVINWILGEGVGWLLACIFAIGTVVLFVRGRFILAIFTAACVAGSIWFAQNADLLYWLYENVIVEIIHYITFYQMDSVLYGTSDKLFLFGAILANAWFRNGHSNKGLVGIVNSWYVGMVLLYATITYGLFTAIALHILYDILCDLVAFFLRPTVIGSTID